MRLAIGPVQRVRYGRGSVEETAAYVEYVRAVLVRHDLVVLDPYPECTEARRAQDLRWGCPGQADERYPVPVVLGNLATQPLVVTLRLHSGQPQAHRSVSTLMPGQSKQLGPTG